MLNHYKIILAEMGDFSVEFSANGRDAVDNYRTNFIILLKEA
jgi:hypothetical protein